ncbi:putative benzoate 4-monooxygenase cytochrome P450 [Durotheca rogersii]|uniref:putative benzoate 4-monooxygenase cytochrome P450 n=1 Tax=Durotheca rogersii TaxID=419775 RepID=UPI0022206AC2|nr:putative benzoate 4-monooxygenase cytochrome P450 [Durotheca rogersii]KAI5857444.1 putative benzoate 4-monooxygenase cytochrome P450 [Durotheca rogersii]
MYSGLLGVTFHLGFARVVFLERFMYQLIGMVCLIIAGLAYLYASAGLPVVDILTRLSIVAGSFNAGLFSSMTIYRLFFHPLNRFPGPLDLKISRIFSSLRAAKKLRYHRDVDEMHEKYGDFVRSGPRELSIRRRSAVATIYGPTSKCWKSSWYTQVSTDSKKSSVHMATDPADHKRRRKAWDMGMGFKALNMYEPRVKNLVDLFVAQLSQRNDGIDVPTWTMYLFFDVAGEAGFGQSFECVSRGIEHPAIQALHSHMSMLSILSHVPWLLNLIGAIPILASGYKSFFDWCNSQLDSSQSKFDPEKSPQDVASWLLRAVAAKDSSASPSRDSLIQDSRVIIVAGSDTSAMTLAVVLYYMAKFPSVFKKLQARVDAAVPTPEAWTYEKVKSISYIDNIIEESLRLKPALLIGGTRTTPPQGIQVDEEHIPGNTNVFVPTQIIHTDPRYWKQATEFVPERFGERRAEMGTNEAPYIPFGLGPTACPGKNLAMMALRIAISRIAQSFDISFAPGETGEEFDTEELESFITKLPPLKLRFLPRA